MEYQALLPVLSTIKVVTTGCFETLVLIYYITWRYISEKRSSVYSRLATLPYILQK